MNEFTKDEMQQLLSVFRDQSLQIVEEMGQDLLSLESHGAEPELIAKLKRAAHTLKGDAGCIGLEGVAEIAHKTEDLLDTVAPNEAGSDRRMIDVLFSALDLIKAAIAAEEILDIPVEKVASVGKRIDLAVAGELDSEVAGVAAGSGFYPALEESADEQPVNVAVPPRPSSRDFVRVEAARLEALMNLAGEMIIARSALNQLGSELGSNAVASDFGARFNNANSHLGKLVSEFQKSVLKIRMVTIDQLFKRLARPMRELAGQHGKNAELSLKGGETELDRTLVDLLYEPLLHLLRNAVDHGLETPEERVAAGKSPTGSILLRAWHEGNQVMVEVEDDGRGIDVDALRTRAVMLGLLADHEARELSDQDAYGLMFVSGLSTARVITQISGRGIGASAVKIALDQIRGSVSVESEVGEGTKFTLRMPLTLAIIRALLFRASGQLLAIPLLSVGELIRVSADEIALLDGVECYRLRDRFISLVRPGRVLDFDRRRGGIGAPLRNDQPNVFIIVTRFGDKKYGVVAEALVGEQELVIKPLDSKWVQNEALAGASVLGDGSVALILDAGAVYRKAIKYELGGARAVL
jgi:two-component system, chemotaxis family, sensor kinase CheA